MKKLLKNIDNKYIRLVAFIAAMANAAAQMMGYDVLPFDSNEIILAVSIGGIVITGAWVYWKNNSFTDMAKNADKWLESMKEEVMDQYGQYKEASKDDEKKGE